MPASGEMPRIPLKAGVAVALASVAITSSAEGNTHSHDTLRPQPTITQYANGPGVSIAPEVVSSSPQPRTPLDAYGRDLYIPPKLREIGGCETQNSPRARILFHIRTRIPGSTASGGFMFLKSTWDNYKGYSEALDAPAWVQVERAKIELKKNGTAPWDASKYCWG